MNDSVSRRDALRAAALLGATAGGPLATGFRAALDQFGQGNSGPMPGMKP